jgi:polyisoprenoid-binding protein YceI
MAWQIDASHTSIEFSVRHMMISKARGQFERFSGTINLDENNPGNTTVDIEIEAASINTRDAQRDGHLRSADFLSVIEYPFVLFKGTSVEVTSANTAKLTGDLTIRDITHPVTLDVEFVGKSKSPWGTTAYGFSATTKISRKEWNLVWNVALETGGVLVGDEITISIEIELVKVAEQQAEAVLA